MRPLRPFKLPFFSVLIIFLVFNYTYGQNKAIDSLQVAYNNSKSDTNKVNTGLKLGWKYHGGKYFDKAIDYSNQTLVLSNKLHFSKGKAESTYLNALALNKTGKLKEALDKSFQAIELYRDLGNKKMMAAVYGNIGNIYYKQSLYPKSLENYQQALRLYEELKMKKEIAGYSGNIGAISERIGEYKKALEYYDKSLKINEEIGNKQGVAINNVCIGNVYMVKAQDSIALIYHFKALEINKQVGDSEYIANNYTNIGTAYLSKDPNKSLEYYLLAYNIFKANKNKNGLSSILLNLGSVYTKIKDYEKSESCLQDALKLARELNKLQDQSDGQKYFSSLYAAKGNYDLALDHYKQYIRLKDSIFSEKNQKDIVQKEMQYEFDKREALSLAEFEKQKAIAHLALEGKRKEVELLEKDNELKLLSLAQSNLALKQKQTESEVQERKVELLSKDIKLKEAENKERVNELQRQKFVRNVALIGIIFVLGLVFFILYSLKKSREANKVIAAQKKEAEEQRLLVEEKQKEIIDSIQYARRIQRTLLPTEKYIQSTLTRINKN